MTRCVGLESRPKKPAKVPGSPDELNFRPNSVGRGMSLMPFGPLVSVRPVDQHDADDLAERERHDGQVVAPQPQHGEAQQHARRRREQPGERQAGPEAQPEAGRHQREGVGADRVEGDVAEVQQPGEPDHDVQPPAEHDVGQHQHAKVEVVAPGEQRQQHREPAADGRHHAAAPRHASAGAPVGGHRLPPGARGPGDAQQAQQEHRGHQDRHQPGPRFQHQRGRARTASSARPWGRTARAATSRREPRPGAAPVIPSPRRPGPAARSA